MVGSFWKGSSAYGTAAPGHRDCLAEPWCLELPQAQSYQELASVHLQGQKTKLNVLPVGKAAPLQHHSPHSSFVTSGPGQPCRHLEPQPLQQTDKTI